MRHDSFAAIIFAVVAAAHAVDAPAADLMMPTKVPAEAGTSAPTTCTNPWDFIATNCQLSWYGITIYGTVDVGGGWQSHGASLAPAARQMVFALANYSNAPSNPGSFRENPRVGQGRSAGGHPS